MSTHRRPFRILSIVVIFTMLFSSVSMPSAYAQGSDGIERQVNSQTGRISFISPENGRVLSASKVLGTVNRPQDPALALAKRFGPEFGLKNPERDLSEIKINRSEDGRIAVRYQQTYQGIPVLGGELIVNTNENGDLYSINGEVSPELSLSVQPNVDPEEAKQTALEAVATWYEKAPEDFVSATPELWVYDEQLLQPSTRPVELVWRLEVTPKDIAMPVRELVLVNAQRGNISLHFNQFDTAWSLSGKTGTVPDIEPTPTVQVTETPLPTPTPEPGITPTPGDERESEDASLSGPTWYVTTTGNNSNICSAPASPCLTIDGAIAQASAGDTIQVASGTYTNTTGNVVVISKGITLSGGWNDTFTLQNGASIIDGGGVRNGILADAVGSTVIIEYFVIQNSYTGFDSGGIYIYGANFTLRNSAVINNTASRGAGIFIINNGSLTIWNSTISSNRASTSGGGIYAINSTVTINNSTIAYNTSNGMGGGLTRESGTMAIKNSILAKNTATNGPDCSGSISSSDHNILGNTAGCTVTSGSGDKFNVDPLMESSRTGTLPLHALQVGSPAINAGDTSTCLTTDQRGLARPYGSACDIGAYEYAAEGGLMIVGGSNQTTRPDSTFALPFGVRLLDSSANPVSGAVVTFTAPASGASGTFADSRTNVTTAITDSDGFATSALFTANNQPGSYTVTATAEEYEASVGFNLQNILANYFVTPNGSDSNSCTSPASPCLTINGAIAKASAGNIIAVASGTYTGSGTEVVLINKGITLSGGWNTTFTTQNGTSVIDGQGARRGISAVNVNVVIDHFTIQNGFHTSLGGGIYSYGGSLTVNNSIVTRNISEWMGGGIYSYGTLLINNATIRGNSAGELGYSGGGGGGGIISYSGTAVINNSAVSGNSIIGGFDGSGIVNFGASFQLNNSTVSGNTGADAIYNSSSFGTVALNYSTVIGNTSGGVRTSFGTITMQNSILANNISAGFVRDCTATLKSFGNNIIGNLTGCNFTAGTSDQIGVNPMLSSYPVGAIPYHALLSGSPAIDAADPTTCLPTDQRGVARPQAGACDIGAYEYTPSGAAASFGISSGSYQRAGASFPFSLPLVVYVVDNAGSPVSGAEVTFVAPASGSSGTFADTGTNSTTAISNEEGAAVSSIFTSNTQVGTYSVTATVSGLPGLVNFVLTNGAWYVSPIGNNANSCNSPAAPCLTISAAMSKASNVDVIMVAAGTYSSISISKSLILSGGWNNSFSAQTGYSTIAGTSATDGVSANSSDISMSRFIVQTSRTGINHSGGTFRFNQGAIVNNDNGVNNSAGEIILTNTTISGNHASTYTGSAILNTNGTVKIHYSTITNNIGKPAVFSQNSGAQLEIGDTILAGNSAGDCYVGSYNTTSTGHNLFGNSPACSGSTSFIPDPTDQLGIDPKLSVLLPGGYHAVQADSPAIDNADSVVCPATDQRGVARPQGGGCDSGAYEFTPAGGAAAFGVASGSNQKAAPTFAFALPLAVYVIDSLGNPVSGVTVTFTAPVSGPSGTFGTTGNNTNAIVTNASGLAVSSIFTANSQLGTYQVAARVSGLSGAANFVLTNGAWYISSTGFDTNSCAAPTSPCRTLNAVNTKAANGDVIEVAAGTYASASITKNLTILGGWNSSFTSQTGYSTVDGNLTSHGISVSASDVSISRFIVRNSDFGVYHSMGKLRFDRGALINNKNGIYNYGGDTTFTNTTISGNHSVNYVGSAISNVSGTVTIQYSTITNNTGSEAIWSANGSAYIVIGNSILSGNPAGDCYVRGPNLTSHGYNIFGSNPICETFVSPVIPDATDQVGVNPNLLPLFPGGYHPLLLGSPAIDAANPQDCPAVDQRNTTRPAGGRCDIGAFEYTTMGSIPKYIFALEGSGQVILVNTEASTRLKAIVLDEDGDSVKGVAVTFTAPDQGASVIFADSATNTSTVVTDAYGIAMSPAFSANDTAGNYVVLATASGIATPASFSLSNSITALQPNIRTYTVDNYSTLPGIFLCDQTQPDCTNGADLHADAAHKYAMGTYSLYAVEHNRNSIDNAGMPVISSVHYSYQYANAGWTGSQMVYGDAYGFPLADDVVAHELTHGVTQYESGLFYYYQSGAINESFSDLWGEYYDQTNGQGNDTDAVRWLMGEDVSGMGAIRSLSNPPAFNDPDKISSTYYYEGIDDNGGVHTNSGVNNKAVFLMVDGGTFNNRTVTALGWEKTIAIYYEANTNLLSSGADYSDLYYALQQACSNLIGQKGITAEDCAQVRNAVDAVEMNAQPALGFNPDAPYCDMGNPVETIFADDLESGAGNWTFSNGEFVRWQLDSPYGSYAHSGEHFLYADDYPGRTTDASAQLAPVTIPARAYLHFSHAYDFQTSSYYYDGGVLEYSLDGGVTWSDADSLIDFNGYTGTVYAGSSNPLQGRSAFVGTSHGYISTRLNLASLAGENVAFRWRMGLDISGFVWGWWVDDVRIYQCPEPETIAPTVSSIARVGPEISSASSVDFTVTFSEPVVGVDVKDFSLHTSPTIVGASVRMVTGARDVYTVTVTTGSGNGTLRLDVPETASITDLPGNPLGELPFVNGELYTIDKTTDINIHIGSSPDPVGTYPLESGESTRQSFLDVNNGPVRVQSSKELPILAAERVIYKVNNIPTSFSEVMGLPDSQLDTVYWLPWYNNVDLDTQLRLANVSDSMATIHIYIGGMEVTPVSGITLLAGESTRRSFAGVNNGPVKIISDVPIVAAERVIYKVNNTNTSFTEMMALPNSQLDTVYWLPWYNNVDLDTQLRFANVNNSPATVHIYIGGKEVGKGLILPAGTSTRQSFPGVNNGPVKIVSDVPLVAAERVIYKVNNTNTSFSEMMALPHGQLDTTYWFPWYNNVDLDTQLRFANVHNQTATVHIYIGGAEMGTGFTLPAGASTRQSFPEVNGGPVQIVSNIPIVAAERVIYKVNKVNTSFSEMMGLPNSQFDTTYWFPWYNNVDLDTQLRFSVP